MVEKFGKPYPQGPLVNRRGFLRQSADAGIALTLLATSGHDTPYTDPAAPQPQIPTLPCGTLVVGGGNTAGIFNALDKSGLLPGGGGWKKFLHKKKVICMGCASGDLKASDQQNAESIHKWCLKQDIFFDGKLHEYSKEKGVDFYRQSGAADVIFIKDAQYNIKHEAKIIEAIKDPDTVFFDCAGGDQDLQMKILNQTPDIKKALKQRWMADPSLMVYTTSASAAALSKHMMSDDEIREGLGWLDNIIVDMHMLREEKIGPEKEKKIVNRVPRLQKGVKECSEAMNPNVIGIGVDEATALVMRRECDLVGGKPAERMTGTILAAVDDDGKVRSGSVSKTHNVYVVRKKDWNKTQEDLLTYTPVAGPRDKAPAGLFIDPYMLTKLTKMQPGQFEEAFNDLPKDTQDHIMATLQAAGKKVTAR